MSALAWRKVCCPVDFSPESRAALNAAQDLCRRFGASLTLLHVQDGGHPPGADDDLLAGWLADARATGLAEVDMTQLRGDPKQVIAEHAWNGGFDLVVMGTHGRTGRAHALVGSVAESTVRRCRCPVMVVHADWRGVRGA